MNSKYYFILNCVDVFVVTKSYSNTLVAVSTLTFTIFVSFAIHSSTPAMTNGVKNVNKMLAYRDINHDISVYTQNRIIND